MWREHREESVKSEEENSDIEIEEKGSLKCTRK